MATITREEYLTALSVVEEYHAQMMANHNTIEKLSRIKTVDFLVKHKHELSARTYRYMMEAAKYAESIDQNSNSNWDSRFKKIAYIDELTYDVLRYIRNIGKRSWIELESLLDKYGREKL